MRRLVDIALNLVGIAPDHPATQVETEQKEKAPPRAMCCKCFYWSGRVGCLPADLVCAVNYPQPTKEDLEVAGNRPAYAVHDCPDFKLKPQPESRTIQLH